MRRSPAVRSGRRRGTRPRRDRQRLADAAGAPAHCPDPTTRRAPGPGDQPDGAARPHDRFLLEQGLDALGLCELPMSTLEGWLRATGHSAAEATWRYAGLNHLGWFWDVRAGGEDILRRLAAGSTAGSAAPVDGPHARAVPGRPAPLLLRRRRPRGRPETRSRAVARPAAPTERAGRRPAPSLRRDAGRPCCRGGGEADTMVGSRRRSGGLRAAGRAAARRLRQPAQRHAPAGASRGARGRGRGELLRGAARGRFLLVHCRRR